MPDTLNNLPNYPAAPVAPAHVPERIQQSIAKPTAFSSPGTTKPAGKGWQPAKGTRFRATLEKTPGRPRKRKRDPRSIKFY